MALWELPGLGEDMGVFWWFHHQNTPIYPLYHRRFPKTQGYLTFKPTRRILRSVLETLSYARFIFKRILVLRKVKARAHYAVLFSIKK